MLGNGELCGAERSIIKHFLPENFLVATPMALMQKHSKGGMLKRPIINPDSISFLLSVSTVSGSVRADRRLSHMIL